jgi:DNA-binding beta-propeller fold protein YncE
MRITRTVLLLFFVASCVSVRHLAAQAQWTVEQTFHIGGEGGWDYVTMDAQNSRLFVTRKTHTLVLDADSGKTLADIPGQKSAHGVAIVPALDRGFITDGEGTGAIIVFDLKTYSVLGKLAAVPDTDGIIYDAGSNLILASAGDSSALLAFRPDIDPEKGMIGAPIDLGGKPEFLAADGHGKAYVNLEDKDVVAVVDLNARKVLAKWPVAPGGHPVGLSIDAETHRLFVGCRNPQKLVVMNAEDGKVEASIPIGAGVDATAFFEGHAFASCRDGTLIVAGEKDGAFGLIQTVKTPNGARTLAFDAKTHRIYLPTAEFEPNPSGRPKAKPGTFMIAVVERS